MSSIKICDPYPGDEPEPEPEPRPVDHLGEVMRTFEWARFVELLLQRGVDLRDDTELSAATSKLLGAAYAEAAPSLFALMAGTVVRHLERVAGVPTDYIDQLLAEIERQAGT